MSDTVTANYDKMLADIAKAHDEIANLTRDMLDTTSRLCDVEQNLAEAQEAARTIWVKWCNMKYRDTALANWPWLAETPVDIPRRK